MPLAVGVKVTLTEQPLPGAKVAGSVPQVLVWAKSPLMLMLLMVSGAPLLLVIVDDCAGLVEPCGRLPNVRLDGFSVTGGGARL